MALLEVRDLRTQFQTRWGLTRAVDGVSFSVDEGETLGLVGESGSGKTMTCLSILRLVPSPAGRIVGGQVLLGGQDLLRKTDREMRQIRGKQVSMILQDAMTSLNPVFSIGNQIGEAVSIHQKLRGNSLRSKVIEMLKMVRIPSAAERMRDYPHQLSGGMRQRAGGAIALSCQPHLLIADEPTTSLDATIQAQYLRLLKDIQKQSRIALVFITHDFGIVSRMCDKVAVMYAGKAVEMAPTAELFDHPAHPYTRGLIESVPKLRQSVERLFSIVGEPPSLHNLPKGCSFAPRCALKDSRCELAFPAEVTIGDNHRVSCWRNV